MHRVKLPRKNFLGWAMSAEKRRPSSSRRASTSVEIAILVLSDLHFGNDLPEGASTQLLQVPTGFSDARVTGFFSTCCKGHYSRCVSSLPTYLSVLLSKLKADGYERDTFDLLILLGDQSTLAHERSYNFLRQYLTQKVYATKDKYGMTFSCPGLDIQPDNILVTSCCAIV